MLLFKRRHVEQLAVRTKKIAGDLGCIWVPIHQMFDDTVKLREPEYWFWTTVSIPPKTDMDSLQEWMDTKDVNLSGYFT